MITAVVTATFFLCAAGILFAGLLVLAERKILNYGPCTVSINNNERSFEINGGSSLLSSCMEKEIFIPSACGGRGSCAYCKVVVTSGAGPIGPVEEPYLSPEDRKNGIRLACQVKVRENLSIELPRSLFSVKKFSATLVHKKPLTHDIVELRIKLDNPKTIEFKAGQYVQLESKEYAGREPVMRAYSISSVPSDNEHIELIVRRVPNGICTTWVFDHLKEGDSLSFSGPYGEFHLRDTNAPIICIAGGSGMAPIWSILRDMREKGIDRKASYFFGAQSQRDLFYQTEFADLCASHPSISFVPALSNEPADSNWQGERAIVTNTALKFIPDTSAYEAYLCGSPGMIDACIKTLSGAGMPIANIFYDKFA
jgi:Na+-transporting NADH:ubiquinone oxidoreductase subunit F